MSDTWRDPPGAWVAFVLGVIVGTPLLVLYSPVGQTDSDSARILAATRFVLDGHNPLEYFSRTQEPVLPPLVFGVFVSLRETAGAMAFAVLSLLVLTGVTAYISYRLTRSLWGSAVAAGTLLSIAGVVDRAARLPMYPLMLSLGYLGGWCAYLAVIDKPRRTRLAMVAGLLLALAGEAHGVGTLFLVAPVLVGVFARSVRDAFDSAARVYAAAMVILVPRLLINLSHGGLDAVTSPRADYWITEGYVVQIQNEFYRYQGINDGRIDFLVLLPDRFVTLLGPHGPWIALTALAGLVFGCRGRTRVFVVSAIGFFVVAITAKRIPPFDRYYAPVWPALGLLAGTLSATALRRRIVGPAVVAIVGVGLVVAAIENLDNRSQQVESERAGVENSSLRSVVAAVDDGKGVIGARATQVWFTVSTDVQTWGDQFLTEEEYVAYLTWPSDETVLEMLAEHDIGWIYVSANPALEVDYNDIWLVPAHGQGARHLDAIQHSPALCPWFRAGNNTLYKVGSCSETGPSPHLPPPVAAG